MTDLFEKYNQPVPRYTSYPTVPHWTKVPDENEWFKSIGHSLSPSTASWSLYLHMPYCESLCHFCGCTKIITADHSRENPYIDLLIQEFDLYLKNVPALAAKPLSQIHLGGGSPTFFSAKSLARLCQHIFSKIKPADRFEGSIEVDPRRLKRDQLSALRDFSFNRVSLGVQDFDPQVQMAVNRFQPLSQTVQAVEWARELGYRSINFDLIYGLPKQTPQTITQTLKTVLELGPDRIALYSLALVPWLKPSQKLFKPADLPEGKSKRDLYELAKAALLQADYIEIGMDHFAKPNDDLAVALRHKNLHRNFMGYTDQKTDVLLGLGMSAISETHDHFLQNSKELPVYQNSIEANALSIEKGHCLTEEDIKRKNQILALMTLFELDLNDEYRELSSRLHEFSQDGLISWAGTRLTVTTLGRPFIRNICAALDEHILKHQAPGPLFSKSI